MMIVNYTHRHTHTQQVVKRGVVDSLTVAKPLKPQNWPSDQLYRSPALFSWSFGHSVTKVMLLAFNYC